MRWSRAVHHLEELARQCAHMAELPTDIFPLHVTALWAYSAVLTSREDLEWVSVVLAVDLPVDDVPWFCPPAGSEHWSQATRMSKYPVVAMWRSTRAPVWNHSIRGPLLIWDEAGGTSMDALAALRNGTADALRLPQPSPDELRSRLQAELAVSLRALESATAAYDQRRFRPGRLGLVAETLWLASAGYLDVLRSDDLPGASSPGLAGQQEQSP